MTHAVNLSNRVLSQHNSNYQYVDCCSGISEITDFIVARPPPSSRKCPLLLDTSTPRHLFYFFFWVEGREEEKDFSEHRLLSVSVSPSLRHRRYASEHPADKGESCLRDESQLSFRTCERRRWRLRLGLASTHAIVYVTLVPRVKRGRKVFDRNAISRGIDTVIFP